MSDADENDPHDRAHWDAVEEATELLHEERYVEALSELKRVLDADPRNAYAYHFTGVALFECGEVEPARDAYRASLVLAPKHLGSRIGLCHCERKLGNFRDAIKEGMVALEQAPTDGDALYAIGMAYFARGEHVAARRYFEAFLKSHPEFEVATEVRGLLEGMPRDLN